MIDGFGIVRFMTGHCDRLAGWMNFDGRMEIVRPFLPVTSPCGRQRANVHVGRQRHASLLVVAQNRSGGAGLNDRSALIEPIAPRPMRRCTPQAGTCEGSAHGVVGTVEL